MTIIQCDICGKHIPSPPHDPKRECFAIDAPYGHFDLCAACWDWVNGRDLNDIYLTALRERWVADHPPAPVPAPPAPKTPGLQKPAQEVSPPVSDPENKPITGPGAAMKRNVLKALDEYRQAHGAGCWVTLAEEAGVTQDQIAQVRLRQKVPMEVWRSLARALNVVDGDTVLF